jgi:hypothetical protein
MRILVKFKKREEGSATLEFLGIVPIALLLLVIIWQFIVGINAVVVAQSAVNEYATVYSITKSEEDAKAAAKKIINTSSNYLSLDGEPLLSFPDQPNDVKNFEVKLNIHIKLVFLPKRLFGGTTPSISHDLSTFGRVIE